MLRIFWKELIVNICGIQVLNSSINRILEIPGLTTILCISPTKKEDYTVYNKGRTSKFEFLIGKLTKTLGSEGMP